MKLNYIKTLITTTIVTSAFSISMPTMAVAPVSVIPAENEPQETLQDFELVFASDAVAAWTVTGTENTPRLYKDGDEETARYAGPNNLSADGNKLTVSWSEEFTRSGKYELSIPANAYTVNGEANEACKFTWEVTGIKLGYSVSPDVSILTELQTIRITFNDNDKVEMGNEWNTDFGAILYIVNEENEKAENRRGTFMPQFYGNTVDLALYTPITEPGDYVVEIPADAFKLDNELFEEAITLNYTIIEPAYPEIELSINPSTNIVEELGTIEITFGGLEIVEWNVTGTENCPHIEDVEGNRVATLAKLGGEGNMLSCGMYAEPFNIAGEYTVVIPEGSYILQGIYHGMPGKEIRLNYEVTGLTGISVEPAANVLNEIQNVRITFHEAKTVEMGNEWGTEFGAVLYIINEENDKTANRRGTFMPQFQGNTVDLTMYSSITEPGEYVIEIPAGAFKLDGNLYEEAITLSYTIAESFDPFMYTVSPETGTVDQLSTVEITFADATEAVWNMEAIQNDRELCPRIQSGENLKENLTRLEGNGNVLIAGPYDTAFAWTDGGEYVVTIPAGSYKVDGEEGEEIILNYIVTGGLGVDAILDGAKTATVYDLNGQVILKNANAAALKQIRGIFVVNGKKYIVR